MIRSLTCGLFLLTWTTDLLAHDVHVYGFIRDMEGRGVLYGATALLKDSTGMLIDAQETGADGRYAFTLGLGQRYTLWYSSPQHLPKHLEVDTRHVDLSEEEMEGGWGMNVDVALASDRARIPKDLLALPFGRGHWNHADSNFTWDLEWTDQMRARWNPILTAQGIEPAKVMKGVSMDVRTANRYLLPGLGLGGLSTIACFLLTRNWIRRVRGLDRSASRVVIRISAQTLLALALAIWSAETSGWLVLGAWACGGLVLGTWLAYSFNSVPTREVLEDDHGVPDTEAERSSIYGGLAFWLLLLVSTVVIATLTHASMRTIWTPLHMLFGLVLGALLFALVRVALLPLLRRYVALRIYRLGVLATVFLLTVASVPCCGYFVDRARATGPPQQVIAEIIRFKEIKFRSTKERRYEVVLLVEGHEKTYRISKAERGTLREEDAVVLSITTGPTGLRHIAFGEEVRRNTQSSADE